MKLSIITVVFNNKETIEDAINSVINQTYNDIEYIIIDGKSTDGTKLIIDKYSNQISKIVSERDNGIYDAMNKGLNLATGDVIGILNSDDLYQDSNVLSDVMRYFNEDFSLDAVYGDLDYVKRDNVDLVVRKWKSLAYYGNFFENGNVPPHTSLFIKRDVYKKAGNFNLTLKLAADYEFMLRIFKKHTITSRYISRKIVRMRLGGSTNKSVKNIIQGNREILQSWKINNLKVPFRLVPLRIFKRLVQFL